MILFQVYGKEKPQVQGQKQDTVRFDISAFASAHKDYTGPNPPGAVISMDLLKTCINWVMDNSKSLNRGYYEIDRKKFGIEKSASGTLREQVGEKNWEKVKKLVETGIKWGEEKKAGEQAPQKEQKRQRMQEPERNLLNEGIKFTKNTDFYTKTSGDKTA
ncbi:MAG: hypothetical protein WCT52_03165 [Candidatus Micrarchaeia archaeon]